MKKKSTKKSKRQISIGKILLNVVVPIVGSVFIYLVLHTENRYLLKEVDLLDQELGAIQNKLEAKIAEVQKLQSEDRIVKLASEKLGMVRIDQPMEKLFVSQEKINRIKKIVNSKYE
jgi:cell division protein FtsL